MNALKPLLLALPVALLSACGSEPATGGGERRGPIRLDTAAWNAAVSYGEASDARDGRRYRTVEVAGGSWMAENLSFAGPSTDSLAVDCYDYDTIQCRAAGRLYTWSQAMAIDARFDSTKLSPDTAAGAVVQGLCPEGWHLPDSAEWKTLLAWADTAAGSRKGSPGNVGGLRAAGAWPGGGVDRWGFRALPAGFLAAGAGPQGDDEFRGLGEVACWWTSDETVDRGARAYQLWTAWAAPTAPKVNRCSVRCVQDQASAAESP